MIYIEKYKCENNFDLERFFGQFTPGIDYQPNWPAVIVSSTRALHDSHETLMRDFTTGKKRSKPSVAFTGGPESLHNLVTRILGLKGMTFSILSACTSSAYAIYQAGLISRDQNTPVIVACADLFSPFDLHWFNSFGAVSPDTGIPFDKNSKGFRPSKAQVLFVVSAKPINPIAEISTMRFMTQPNEKTAVGSLDEILSLFDGIDLSKFSWWNAHAPGTPLGDASEFELFSKFNLEIPISSIKGQFGHALASSYLLELGSALDSVQVGLAKKNVGLIDPIVDDKRIIKEDYKMNNKSFIKFNMGFGGKNVLSLINVYA